MWVKTRKIPVHEDKKNGKESLYVRIHSNGGDANCKCMSVFSHSWGEWENVCVRMNSKIMERRMVFPA